MTARPWAVAPLLGLALAVLWAAEVGAALGGGAWASGLGMAVYGIVLCLALPGFPRSGLFVFGLAAAGLVVVALTHEAPLQAILTATERGAFLAALFVALAILREASRTSRAVERCGAMLVAQPPSQRYFALSLGSGLLSVVLNFGAVNLLGGMVDANNTLERAGGDERVVAIRRRRMLLALLRGFSVAIMTSPLSIAYAVVLSSLPGLTWPQLLVGGLGAAVLFTLLGGVVDRVRRGAPSGVGVPSQVRPPRRDGLPMLLIVLGIVGAVLALEAASDLSLFQAVTLGVPIAALAWIVVQERGGAAFRMIGFVRSEIASYRAEIVMVSMAGFVGVLLAGALPIEDIRAVLLAWGVPGAVLLGGMIVVVLALGQLGMNPIISVTALAAVFSEPEMFGLAPLPVALALIVAWGLCAGFSTGVAAVLIVARYGREVPRHVTNRWNGPLTLMGLVLLYGYVLLIHALV